MQASGIYHVKEEYIRKKNGEISDYYLELYRWYTNTAREYTSIPKELLYPIWLSVSGEIMLQPTENTVILKLEVPKDKVVICNMEAWGYVVNYWYVPLNEQDAKEHAEELKRNGISEEDELISTSKGNFYPMLRRKIQNSWKRVFTMPPANDKEAVATIWELKREWVKEVQGFGDQSKKLYHVDGTDQ